MARSESEMKRRELRRLIQLGADQLQRGEVVDGEDVFHRLQAKHDQLKKTKNHYP